MGRILVLAAVLSGCGLAMTAAAADSAPGGVGVMVTPSPAPGAQAVGQPLVYQAPMFEDEALAYPPSHPRIRQWMANHRREPEGIPHPMGADNAWTEFKFVFGSTRQFMGAAEASEGVWCKTTNPAPWERPRSDKK